MATPKAVYTDPEIALVGLSEEERPRRRHAHRVLRWPFSENDRAQAERMTEGEIKIVTTGEGQDPRRRHRGRRRAAELIVPWTLAVKKGLDTRANFAISSSLIRPFRRFRAARRLHLLRGRRRESRWSAGCSASSGSSADGRGAKHRHDRTASNAWTNAGLAPEGRLSRGAGRGLSGRLLILTVLFVMLSEVLIYVPSIANFRRNWLKDRIGAAQIAALVLDAAPAGAVPPELERKLVMQLGAVTVAIAPAVRGACWRVTDMPPNSGAQRRSPQLRRRWLIGAPSRRSPPSAALYPHRRARHGRRGIRRDRARRSAAARGDGALLHQHPAAVAADLGDHRRAGLCGAAPADREAGAPADPSIMAFEQQPEDAGPSSSPAAARDEIGMAEHALAAMQKRLAEELRAEEAPCGAGPRRQQDQPRSAQHAGLGATVLRPALGR